jgi:hypothetical protein
MITEDYVSFEAAKLLKEKGFRCDTLHYYYDKDGDLLFSAWRVDAGKNEFVAPTLQMAIKWLKEEHNLGVIPHWSQVSGEFGCHIYDLTKKGSQEYHSIRGSFEGFEEPAELGIKYCLENLI